MARNLNWIKQNNGDWRLQIGQIGCLSVGVRYKAKKEAPQSKNIFSGAWWEAESKSGGIGINGVEHEIFAGKAEDYYAEPEDTAKAAEWNPERTVYVVKLPTADGEMVISSYGITNLIRSVCRRNAVIG